MGDRSAGGAGSDAEAGASEAWAEAVVAGLDGARAAECALADALRPAMSVKEENAQRRAEAVRAAAMGLGAAGCASAAGVSERLLASWRAEDPVFDAALSAARSLAHVHGVVPDVAANPAVLRVALDAILRGVPFIEAGALVGVKRDTFYRLRRGNPHLGALFGAAQNLRRRSVSPGRQRKTGRKGYRLVRLDASEPPRADPDA
ncbi:hypothetical protein ACFXKK_06925 [Streptomyces globisporus]|uniref:hypothetical protein n=1 Tax=Streptomyces globisporus TaxID=1908 RepID=UPI003646DA61